MAIDLFPNFFYRIIFCQQLYLLMEHLLMHIKNITSSLLHNMCWKIVLKRSSYQKVNTSASVLAPRIILY